MEASAVREVVRRRDAPCALFAKPREVIGMVVVVMGENVEAHEPEQLLGIPSALREEVRYLKEALVIERRRTMRNFHNSCCRQHVNPPAVAHVETLRAKETRTAFRGEQLELGHGDATLSGTFHVFVFD